MSDSTNPAAIAKVAVEKIWEELALIERRLAADGSAALGAVRAALKRIHEHSNTIHAAASPLADGSAPDDVNQVPLEPAPTPPAAAGSLSEGASPPSSVASTPSSTS